jgi:hypothetical protein
MACGNNYVSCSHGDNSWRSQLPLPVGEWLTADVETALYGVMGHLSVWSRARSALCWAVGTLGAYQ